MKDYWTSNDGREIEYPDLTDTHLKNIIADGYRNGLIEEEALRRGFEVPIRPVDKMSFRDLCMFREALASCSLEGNETASNMLCKYEEDPDLFFLLWNGYLMRGESSYD